MSGHTQALMAQLAAVPAPPTPLGSIKDSALSWATWVTLMGFVGMVAFTLVAAGPAARRLGSDVAVPVTTRLARIAVALGILALPAVLFDAAHGLAEGTGYDIGAAWSSLYDGSSEGILLGVELTLIAVGVLLIASLTRRRPTSEQVRPWLLGAGLVAGAIALGTTKFPTKVPDDWGRTVFETSMWMMHLFGGAVWIGGLIGLLVLALPPTVLRGRRGAFWSTTIRRFSAAAMSCVGAVTLSGLWLYWSHVDGPTQLLTTMYGRVLGVKILIFGTMLLLGMVNQFWLHPRIDALRAAGDELTLLSLLLRRFPAVVAIEVLLGLTVLMVAPFLHGSARNQAFQADAAKQASSVTAVLPKLPAKQVTTSTWVWGTSETVAVAGVMIAGYAVSGRIAQRRVPLASRLGIEQRQSLDA